MPSAPTSPGRVWLLVLAAVSIALLTILSAGLLMEQRQAALDRAKSQVQREVQRLAAELDQSLRLAQASITVADGAPASADLLMDHAPLVQALNLPFELRRLTPEERDPGLPARRWRADLPRQVDGRWYLPLRWQQDGHSGGLVFEAWMAREALLARFASEGLPGDSSMSLFRIEDDGATTVLARHPLVESEQGKTIRGHLATAVAAKPSGVFQATAAIDGVQRIVGYQRLEEPAQQLMIVYALGTQGVLAGWGSVLPWAVVLTLLVAFAMAWGAWRLDRSIRDLRQSEQHFQTLTGHLPDVVIRYDRSLRILYANQAIEAANGLKAEAVLGCSITDIGAPPELAQRWSNYIEQVFRTGQSETLHFFYPGPNGERHWESYATLEPSLPGKAPTVLVVSRDITERHLAQARLLAAQHLFETVFQAAPEAMSLSDWSTGQLLLVNDAFCELFGRTREALVGRTSTELGLWSASHRRADMLDALASGGRVRGAEGSSIRPDGQEIHVRYSAERVEVDGQARLLLLFRDVTQLEQEQRALARSELRFRLAASQGQVWEWDFSRNEFLPNHNFFVYLGYPPPTSDQTRALFFDLIHPEDLPKLRLVMRRFLKGEADYRLEFRARDAQGIYHWFDTRGSGLRDAQGRVTYMAGTTFDISDRKALEEAQRQILTQLETVANASPALFWSSGTDGHLDWFNQAWLDFTGRTLEQETGEGWHAGVHPDDLDPGRIIYEEAFENREPFQMQYRLRRHDGQYRWMLVHGKPRYDADNRFLGFIGSSLDVTERQEATRERERLSRFVLMLFRLASRFINLPVEQMDSAIDEALRDVGRFVQADRAYLFTYDWSAQTASNTHEWCADGVSAEIENLQCQPMNLVPDWIQSHRQGQRVQIDDALALTPGPLRDMLESQGVRSLTTIPLMTDQECLGFVGLDWVRDCHEWVDEEMTLLELFARMLVNTQLRARTEEKLHELTEQLEQKVAERTAQLQSSVQRLQTVNRELEAFTYSASHDLRTPLRGIEGFSALLLADHAQQLDAQGREYLQRIQRATLHMSQLITDLLAYARLEQVTQQMEPVNLQALLLAVVPPFQDLVAGRQGSIEQQVPAELMVMADRNGMTMVLRNLLDNALKFTPLDRAPRIRIEAHQEGAVVHLSVTDNGQGFDMKYHDRIFGMFQRLHRQDQIPGTGIGLALVHKAVERMGGSIRAESTPGCGSVFHLTVGAGTSAADTSQPAQRHT